MVHSTTTMTTKHSLTMNSSDTDSKWLRHALPYINAHRHQVMVLAISGHAILDDNVQHIVHDIALLNSLGIKLVIVHGARPQINQRLTQRQLKPQYHQGLRITDRETLVSVQDAAGAVRIQIEALLSMGLVNSPMHGAQIRVCSGNFVTAKPVGVVDGIDHHHTGHVRRIDTAALQRLLNKNAVVLLSNLGYSTTGEVFNLSYEEVATETAMALGANKLIFFNDAERLHDGSQQALKELTPDAIDDIIMHYHQQGRVDIAGQLQLGRNACEHGVPRVHFISYQRDGALLEELFSRDGSGTLLTLEGFEHLHQASIDDVGGILELIEPLETNGTLLKRSRELLETEIHHFSVIKRDGMIIACAALYPFADEHMAEIACIAVHPDYRGSERGQRLLLALEHRARANNINELFVLTTRTAHWFIEHGFSESDLAALPQHKQALYNFQRNSKVFLKAL